MFAMRKYEKCRLCLELKPSTINLWSEIGEELEISLIISQHFWFQPSKNDTISDLICVSCWTSLKRFHQFYVAVQKAQEALLLSCDSTIDLVTKIEVNEIEVLKEEIDLNQLSEQTTKLFDQHVNPVEVTSCDIELRTNSSDVRITRKLGNKAKLKRKYVKTKTKKSSEVITDTSDVKLEFSHSLQNTIKTNEKQEITEDERIRQFFQLDCRLCTGSFISFVDVKSHYRKVHSTTGYVMCCDKKFFRRGGILEHIDRHLNPDDFRCKICQKIYSDRRQLSIHMYNHGPEDGKQFKCDICGKRFLKKYYLAHHMSITHVSDDKKIHKCEECGKRFALNSILQSHIRGVHQLMYMNICDICAKVFKSRAQWSRHQLEHTNEKPKKLKCLECEAWLKNDKGLKDHIKRCHEQKPASCEICGKVSPNQNALRSHIRYVHESERLHKCSVCEKAFKTSLALKEHMASHTGRVLYICPHCPRTFNSRANMHAHRKRKHREEWERDRAKKMESEET